PAAGIAMKDVERVYGGLLPAGADDGSVQLLREHELYDHGKDDHIDGVISVKGVKFTEARDVAGKDVHAAFTKLRKRRPTSMAAVIPLYGGQMGRFENFLTEETQRRSRELSAELVRQLISQYGSGYANVLKYLKKTTEETMDIHLVTRAEVLHGIREEMAQKLVDIVFRRTTVALPGNLTETSLKTCAAVMA